MLSPLKSSLVLKDGDVESAVEWLPVPMWHPLVVYLFIVLKLAGSCAGRDDALVWMP